MRTTLLFGVGLLVVMVLASPLNGCDRNEPAVAEEYFQQDVVPVLEARCGAAVCHGITPAGRAAGEELSSESYLFYTDDDGTISDWRQARRESLRFVNTTEDADFSTLIRKPLPTVYGGLAHSGNDNFVYPEDPSLQTLRAWIEIEEAGGEDPEVGALNSGHIYFEEEVMPHLLGRNCASTSCHGASAVNGFRLDSGMPDANGGTRFSKAMMRDNYDTSRSFLALDGDPAQSRLLKKGLPFDEGGITHRGGNQTFFSNLFDPAAQAIVKWAEVEREKSALDDVETKGDFLRGVVFIKGPARRASPFDVTSYNPGSDLYLRKFDGEDSSVQNLTEHLHDGDADIRDPAVCPDGQRVAFAMRTADDDGHSIFELDLDNRQITARTDSAGTDVMPTYGPQGELYFVSDRHGYQDERGEADLSIYKAGNDVENDGESPQRITFGVGPEINPRYFDVGDMQGRLIVAHRRTMGPRDETVGFSFPLDFHADYHIYFGVTAEDDHFLVFEEMPDGRALTILGDPENMWSGGKLALIDRNLGPDLRPDEPRSEAAVPAFVQNLRVLDTSVRATGTSAGGIYRDPVALPDGTILVAWTPGPIELGEPDITPRFRILHITLREAPTGCTGLLCQPDIATTREWLRAEEQELSVHSPRPVVRRRVAPGEDRALAPRADTFLQITDAAVNQGILQNPFAGGEKYFRDDLRYLRLVEARPAPVGSDLAEQGLGEHLPGRILGEVELEADRSAYLQIPAHTPFRTQLLDANRMAVGKQHNRWIFAWPGQTFPESIDRGQYDIACGGCHGARSGNREDVVANHDALTKASATLAAFEDRNPRRPAQAVVLDEQTHQELHFATDVQPILDEHCTACHGDGADPGGGLVLLGDTTEFFSTAYKALMTKGSGSGGGRKYVDAANTSARTSYLIEVAAGREFDAPRPLIDHPKAELNADELLTLIQWIETGAAFGNREEK